MPSFPQDLASFVHSHWPKLVAGSIKAPPRPPQELLRQLLEVAFIASTSPEEGRYPKFNLLALPSDAPLSCWRFSASRPYEASELRRLLPATDPKKSTAVVEWDKNGELKIVGLHDMGTSWHRARSGLRYDYAPPEHLLIEVLRPGSLAVFQGEFKIASLCDGKLKEARGLDMTMSLHRPANDGIADLGARLVRPEIESESQCAEFESIALRNVYAAIANSIRATGHGGALVILPEIDHSALNEHLRVKYSLRSDALKDAFVEFLNARHKFVDEEESSDDTPSVVAESEETCKGCNADKNTLAVMMAQESLVEATRFVAQLANCDGALILSRDLTVVGFAAEIRAEMKNNVRVAKVIREESGEFTPLDVECFGMRHRSAIKLVSQHMDATVLVVSQDGPVSVVWSSFAGAAESTVLVREDIALANGIVPWSG